MENSYELGGHKFQSEEEYHAALVDYEYIKQFMEKLDLTKPEKAKELYERLNKTDNLLQSEVGEAFKDKLAQIFVSDEVRRIKEKYPKRQQKKEYMMIGYYIHFLICSVFFLLEMMNVFKGVAIYAIICEIIYSFGLLGYLYYLQVKRYIKNEGKIGRILFSGFILCLFIGIMG